MAPDTLSSTRSGALASLRRTARDARVPQSPRQLLERAAEHGYQPVAREYIHYCREIYHVAKRSVCGAECAGNDTLQPGLYPAWPLDLQLVGVRCHTEDKECRRMKRGRCCSAFNSDGEKLFDQRWPGFSKSF